MPTARFASVGVGGSAAVVLDSHALDVHGERSLGPINWPTSPLAGSVDGGTWLISSSIRASNPVSHLDAHRRLWEVLAIESERIRIEECADNGSINGPLDVGGGPVDGVGVPSSDGISDILVDSSVVGRGVALSEEVALHRCILRTQPFPINLVEVIRFQNETADDTLSRGCLRDHFNHSEEDIFLTLDGWRVCRAVDCELSSIRSIR